MQLDRHDDKKELPEGIARMVEDARAKIAKARKEAEDISRGVKRWTMCVPVQPETDSDIVMHDAFTVAGMAIDALVRECTSSAGGEPDGYAVLLDDPKGDTPGGCGYWYVGAYRTEAVAKNVAERGKQGARVVPMWFAPTSTPSTERELERPKDFDAALERIDALCREVQVLCDEFDIDPYEYLADDEADSAPNATAQPSWIEEELRDGDRICEAAGVQRTEGGRLPVAKIINAIKARPVPPHRSGGAEAPQPEAPLPNYTRSHVAPIPKGESTAAKLRAVINERGGESVQVPRILCELILRDAEEWEKAGRAYTEADTFVDAVSAMRFPKGWEHISEEAERIRSRRSSIVPSGDVEWLHRFINCAVFSPPPSECQRAHQIVDALVSAKGAKP